jgi:hypothetical protein
MVRQGLKALVGAHGEQPLGLNFHAEMFFTQQGGLTNYEVRNIDEISISNLTVLFPDFASCYIGCGQDIRIIRFARFDH